MSQSIILGLRMNWNIKIQNGGDKKLEINVDVSNDHFKLDTVSPPSANKMFSIKELEMLKNMVHEMVVLGYTKMECTKL